MRGDKIARRSSTDDLFSRVSSSNDLEQTLHDAFRSLGCKYYLFQLGSIKISEFEKPFVKTNYPSEWIARYLLNGYVGMDAVTREGFRRNAPFDWRDLALDEGSHKVMADARNFELGRQGYSIPVADGEAKRSLLSVTSDMADEDWERFIHANRNILVEVASLVHERAITENSKPACDGPALGPRELECLTWTAHGKHYLEIAEILGISGHTVRGYLKSARFKLECVTLPQAVARALKLGLITV